MTSFGNMSEENDFKAQLNQLMQKRKLVEQQVSAASQRLEAAGVGMKASLLDGEVCAEQRSHMLVILISARDHSMHVL